MAKVLAAGEDSAQQNGRVNGGNLGIPNSLSVINVGKVVEEAAMVRQLLPEEPKGGKNAFQRIAGGNEAALISDAKSGQTKPGGCNAGHDSFIIGADAAAVFHHPRFGAGLLPKITEVGNFQLVQKLVVFGRQSCQTGRSDWSRRSLLRQG